MKEIKLSNQTVSMREPKVRDVVALDNVEGESKKEINLISSLTQLTQDELTYIITRVEHTLNSDGGWQTALKFNNQNAV